MPESLIDARVGCDGRSATVVVAVRAGVAVFDAMSPVGPAMADFATRALPRNVAFSRSPSGAFAPGSRAIVSGDALVLPEDRCRRPDLRSRLAGHPASAVAPKVGLFAGWAADKQKRA